MEIVEIEPQARRNLLKLAEVYCAAVRIGADKRPMRFTTLSRKASGDHRLFDALKAEERRYQAVGHRTNKKGSVTLRVYDQLILWFSVHWPADTEFPTLSDLTHKLRRYHHGTTERQQEQGSAEAAGQERRGDGNPSGAGRADGGATGLLAKLRGKAG